MSLSKRMAAVRAPSQSAAYSAPAAARTLSPKQARKSQSGTWAGSKGEVAPLVTNGMPARRHRRGRQHLVGVAEADDRRHLEGGQALRVGADERGVGLAVALQQLHAAAEQAAGGVDAVDGQARPVQRRAIQCRLRAREVVDGADVDRLRVLLLDHDLGAATGREAGGKSRRDSGLPW